MAARRDQLQAYQFMMRRVTSALIVHETDPEQTPLRRGVGAVFAGVMIAVLIAAGFGVYGAVTGVGGTSWQADGAVVIEKETGATYVYQSGSLQPVLNIASARLAGGSKNPEPHRVAGEALAGLPRKPIVGIAGAPNSLPPADRLVGSPWTMCSTLGGGSAPRTTLLAGGAVGGGRALGSSGLLVRDAGDGAVYLIWSDHRYRITGVQPGSTLRSLFGARPEIAVVGTAWLNGLPAGQDIGPIAVEGRGSPSTIADGLAVGDVVFHPTGRGEQHYLVGADGLAPLTELQVRILRGQYSVTPQEISASVANAAPASSIGTPVTGDAAAPDTPPDLADLPGNGEAVACASTADVRSGPTVSLGGDVSSLGAAVRTTAQTSAGTKLADQVLVPPGRIAVVRSVPSGGTGAGALNIVTDLGLRFPVPSADVLAKLGYQASAAVTMPASLVQRIPAGPTLEPSAALRPVRTDP